MREDFGNFFLIYLSVISLILIIFSGCTQQSMVYSFVLPAHNEDVNYDEKAILNEGTSMSPTFFPGNTLLWKNYRNQQLKEGQIICYGEEGTYGSCHRIITVSTIDKKIVVKGDNNNIQEFINMSDIKGIIVGVLYT